MRTSTNAEPSFDHRPGPRPLPLKFTPAEWRFLLEDPAFLREPDNSYAQPRSLMGLPVLIVPDHSLG